MATSLSVTLPVSPSNDSPASSAAGGRLDLASLAVGARARVVSVAVDPQALGWLRAVGIEEGEVVEVLRRAPFGGPLHVRTGAGGEFALHPRLARSIRLAGAGGEASRDASDDETSGQA